MPQAALGVLAAADWMSVTPALLHVVSASSPSVLAFGRSLGREARALMRGTSALITETPESSLAPSSLSGYSRETVSLNQEASSP